ncbi:MAG: leucine-rich repeat protein [Bacteroidales bacterium]|nr:leucine-rich repeat protein [Bacteroidales bacterium]
MSSLKIPSSVTRIERGAFYNAGTSGLKSLTIPGSVKYLGRNAFTNLRECTSLTISNGVDSIDIYCFSRLCSLQSVTIPSSVKWIGKRAFQDCEKLSTVNYNATDCAGITFSQNDSSWFFAAPITKVTIGESVKTIPHNLMFNQTKLASVTIPGTVTSIGANAFAGCTNLMDIYVAHKAPVLLSADIANAPVHAKAFVHVPEGCDKYYKGRDYWKNFQYIFDDNGTYQPAAEGDINHDGVVNVSDVAALINKILGK